MKSIYIEYNNEIPAPSRQQVHIWNVCLIKTRIFFVFLLFRELFNVACARCDYCVTVYGSLMSRNG